MILIEFFDSVPCCDSGSRIEVLYSPDVRPDGQIVLVPTGSRNRQEVINSYRDSCDINSIVDRFLLTGDSSLLQRSNSVFADVLNMPKTLAEAYAMTFRAEHAFDSLPAETKNLYGGSYMRFLEDIGSPTWLKALGLVDTDIGKEGDSSEKS